MFFESTASTEGMGWCKSNGIFSPVLATISQYILYYGFTKLTKRSEYKSSLKVIGLSLR